MSGINFPITGDNSSFISAMNGVRTSVGQTMSYVEQEGNSIETMFKRIGEAAGIAFGVAQVKEFANAVMDVRGQFQQLEVAFTTMLGSADKANNLMQQITKTAATTPFDLKGVADGAKSLMAYGTAADEVNGMLIRLGDIAAGMSIPLKDLVYLYGTTMVQGRMFTQDLRQFQGRGIPIAEELAKVLKVAKEQIPDLVTEGKITSDVFKQAIENMTNTGSKFGGLMEAQSKTITGQISNIEDSIDMMLNEIGKNSEGFINEALSNVSTLIENYQTVGKVLLTVAAAYGSYKAALVATLAIEKAQKNLTAKKEIEGLQEEIDRYRQLLPEKEKAANADLAEAVAKGKLSEAQADLIAQKREELSLLMDEQNKRVSSASEKVSNLSGSLDDAKKRLDLAAEEHLQSQLALVDAKDAKKIADDRVASAEKYVEQLHLMADAEGVAFEDLEGSAEAMEELSTAVTEQLAAAKDVETMAEAENTAATALNTAETRVNALSEQLDTAQTELNTVATGANTTSEVENTTATGANTIAERLHAIQSKASAVATTIFSVAVNNATKMLESMKVAIMTNPLGVLIGALTIIIPLLYQFFGSEDDATAKTKRFGESADEATSKVKSLFAVLQTTNRGTKTANDAINELTHTYEEYGVKLDETIMKGDDEGRKIDEIIGKREKLIAVIQKESIERQAANEISEANDNYNKKVTETKDDIKDKIGGEWSDSAKEALVGLIDDKAIDQVTSKLNRYNEIVKELQKTHGVYAKNQKEATDAWAEYESAVMSITNKTQTMGESLKLSQKDIDGAKKAIRGNISTLVEHRNELNKTTQETNDARQAALEASGALDKSTERARLSKKTLSEIKQELDNIAKRNNIDIDVNIRYNEENQMPEALKKFTSGQWKNRAAEFERIAQNFKGNEKRNIYDSATGQTKLMTREDVLNEGRRAANEGSDAQAREDEAKRKALADAEEKKKNAKKYAQQAKERAQQKARQIQEERRYQEELAKIQREAIDARTDATIAAERNATLRERKEQDEQHQRNLRSIEDQANEMRKAIYEHNKTIWENSHKDSPYELTKEGQAGWSGLQLSKEQQEIISAQTDKENAEYNRLLIDRHREDVQYMQDYLKEYGTFQQQKLVIAEEYAEKIKNAQSEGEKLKLMAERDKQIGSAKANELARGIDFSQVFDGVGNIVKSLAEETYKRVQEYKKTDEYKNDSAENKKAIAQLEARLIEKGGAGSSSPFSGQTWDNITIAAQKYDTALEKLQMAYDKHTEAVNNQEQAQKEYDNVMKDANSTMAEQLAAQKKLNDAKQEVRETGEKQTEAQNEVDESGQNLQNSANAAAKGLEDFNTVLGQVSSGSLKGFADGVSNVIASLTKKTGDDMKGLVGIIGEKAGGIIGAILSIIDMLGDHPDEFIKGILDGISKVIEAVISHIPEIIASVVAGVGNMVLGVFNGIANLFGLGSGSNHESEVSNRKELDTIINDMNEGFTRLENALKESYGGEALKNYEEALKYNEKQMDAAVKGIHSVMDDDYGNDEQSHEFFDRWYTSQVDFLKAQGLAMDERLQANFRGQKEYYYGINSLLEMNDPEKLAEAFKKMRDESPDLYYGMFKDSDWGGDLEKWMNQLLELQEKTGGLKDRLYEQLTGTTDDNMFSSFMNSLYELADGSEDVFEQIQNDWDKMVNHLLVNNIVGDGMKKDLEKWYKEQFAEPIEKLEKEYQGREKDADYERRLKAITDAANESYEAITKDAYDKVEKLRNSGMLKDVENPKDQQKASFNSAKNITYEQADALVGIETAQQIVLEQIKAWLYQQDFSNGKDVVKTENVVYSGFDYTYLDTIIELLTTFSKDDIDKAADSLNKFVNQNGNTQSITPTNELRDIFTDSFERIKDTVRTISDALPYEEMKEAYESNLGKLLYDSQIQYALAHTATEPNEGESSDVNKLDMFVTSMQDILAQNDGLEGFSDSQLVAVEQGNITREFILQYLQGMNNVITGDGGLLSLLSQGNQTREEMFKAMKQHYENFTDKINKVINELQSR